jgi:ABC-type Fe3+-hydroxamate transport system substrate-binding protein
MKPRLALFVCLLAVILAACAPAGSQTQAPPTASSMPGLPAQTPTPPVDLTATRAYTDNLNSVTPPAVQLVVTSRGPNLEATDPKTVSMASGGLQFVEFFEFW